MGNTPAPTANAPALNASTRFRVAVVMQRTVIARSGWSVPHWSLGGFLPDDSPPADTHTAQAHAARTECGKMIRRDETGEHYLWSGFEFELYADSAEQYWHSLIGNQPALYVVCREDETRELVPHLVTVDYDEAGAYVEADDKVFSGPIPAAIYAPLEAFVLQHYHPEEKKVRQRKAWKKPDTGDEAFAPRPRI